MNNPSDHKRSASEVQRQMLDRGWTLADLDEAAALHAYLEGDRECRQALEGYDQVRSALAGDHAPPDADAEPVDGWPDFEERLAARIRAAVQPARRDGRMQWTLQLAVAFVLAATAAVAGYLAGGGTGNDAPQRVDRQEGTLTSSPHDYLPADVEQQVGVFREVSEVFEHRTGWVAFANGRSELGMASAPVVEPTRLLLLRLSLTRSGSAVSQTDMVIVPGQHATLSLPLAGGRSLYYRLHVDEQRPARLGLWAELESPDGRGETLAALATHLDLQSGKVVPAGSMATSSGGYELTLGFREVERPAETPDSTGSATPW